MSSPDELTRGEKRRITRLRADLLSWYDLHAREFPWRVRGASTFERICVEVLLQRTRAETVAGIYPRFFSRFQGWDDLARATISELESQFRPIGLWQRRAHSIKALATHAAAISGEFPANHDDLIKIPGVGQYVANAILVLQHGKARPLLDVNMARLIERYLRARRLADIRHDPWLQQAAHWLVKGDKPERINWAVLDFAAVICKARAPLCAQCPLSTRCNAVKQRGRISPS